MWIVLGRLPCENRHQRSNLQMAQSDGEKGIPALSKTPVLRGCRARVRSSCGIPFHRKYRRAGDGLRATFSSVQQNLESLGARSRTPTTCERNFPRVVSREPERTPKCPTLVEQTFFPPSAITFRGKRWNILRSPLSNGRRGLSRQHLRNISRKPEEQPTILEARRRPRLN